MPIKTTHILKVTSTVFHSSPSTHVPSVTQIDFASPTSKISPTLDSSLSTDLEDVWDHRIHRFLPVLLAFSIIGILTVLGSLVYLIYRLYQAHCRRSNSESQFDDHKHGSPISATLSHIIPWLSIPSPLHPTETSGYLDYQPKQDEPIRYEKSDLHRIINDDTSQQRRPSLAPSWLSKLFTKPIKRHMSLPIIFSNNEQSAAIDNLNIPISSTFVPIDTSSLTLVPRSEIWEDPTRRRGVNELDMWERKNSGAQTIVAPSSTPPLLWQFPSNQEAYPDSPESFNRRFSEPDRLTSRKYLMSTIGETLQDRDNSATSHEPSSSITVRLPKPKQNDVSFARHELEESRLHNSSSQWLYPSGSKSLY